MKGVKYRVFLMTIIIGIALFQSYGISPKSEDEERIKDVFHFEFSMKDFEGFNALNKRDDTSIKAGLTIKDITYDVTLRGNKGQYEGMGLANPSFILEMGKDEELYGRQAYDFVSLNDELRLNYQDLHALASKLDIYAPKPFMTNIKINRINYGTYLMKQRYDKDFLEERQLDSAALFMIKKGKDEIFNLELLYSSLHQRDGNILKAFEKIYNSRDTSMIMNYLDSAYIEKIKTLTDQTGIREDFYLSGDTVYLYNSINKKVYPIVDPLLILKEHKVDQVKTREKTNRMLLKPEADNLIHSQRYRLEKIVIGDTEGQIDHDNRVIFINLESGSKPRQSIHYAFSQGSAKLLIQGPKQKDVKEWLELQDGRVYDFGAFIYKGKLAYMEAGTKIIYDLYVTTGQVPIIEISTENEHGDVLEVDISDKIPCTLRIVSTNKATYSNRLIPSSIEISGKTSHNKKSYSLKMDKKYRIGGMSLARNWILDSSVEDQSFMRRQLSYDTLRAINKQNKVEVPIPETQYVEVILNNQYQGLYTLSQKIDEEFLGLEDFKPYERYPSLLFKSVNLNGQFSAKNNDLRVYKKNYKEFPRGRQPVSKDHDPIYGWHSGYEQKWPDKDQSGEHWRPLEAFIKRAVQSSDEAFNKNVFDWVDKERLINFGLLIKLQNNPYGSGYGTYVIRESGENQKWFFMPWYHNATFGRSQEMNQLAYDSMTMDFLLDRSLMIDLFKENFMHKWRRLRAEGTITYENYQQRIENYVEEIEDAQKRNFKKWPRNEEATFYDEVDYIKSWLDHRIRWLDTYFDSL